MGLRIYNNIEATNAYRNLKINDSMLSKSLERLSSPERLDQLLHVVDRKNWVPLLSVAMLTASLLAWAIFGWIPINVEGRGILIRPRRIVEIQSPGEGRLVSLRVEIDDVVHKGEVLAIIARPDLEAARPSL